MLDRFDFSRNESETRLAKNRIEEAALTYVINHQHVVTMLGFVARLGCVQIAANE